MVSKSRGTPGFNNRSDTGSASATRRKVCVSVSAMNGGRAVGEASALDQLHREVGAALVLADFVDGNDVGMVQAGNRFRLAAETLARGLIRKLGGEQHFHCDEPLQTDLPRAKDCPHAATGDFFKEFVVPETASAARAGFRLVGTDGSPGRDAFHRVLNRA